MRIASFFEDQDQPCRRQHAGPWAWLQILDTTGAVVRTVFLPSDMFDAFCSTCDAFGRIPPEPDPIDGDGRCLTFFSMEWPFCLRVVSSPDDFERFIENLCALPERIAAA